MFFYVLATSISFVLAYKWVFGSTAHKGKAVFRYLLLQLFGIILNYAWMEAGLRFTSFYPAIIAAAYFIVWPFISFTTQQKFIFK